MRITIIGQPGSGKTTLAGVISNQLAIPHIHIDRFWFESGGRTGAHDTPNIEQVRERVREKTMAAIAAETWVSDGFFSRVQPMIADRADQVIFLDIPLWQRLLNHASRTFHRSTRHKETSFWNDLQFFLEIIRRTFSRGPQMKEFISHYQGKVVILKSRKETRDYLKQLSCNSASQGKAASA